MSGFPNDGKNEHGYYPIIAGPKYSMDYEGNWTVEMPMPPTILCRVTPVFITDTGSQITGSSVVWRVPAEITSPPLELSPLPYSITHGTPQIWIQGLFSSPAFSMGLTFKVEFYRERDDVILEEIRGNE